VVEGAAAGGVEEAGAIHRLHLRIQASGLERHRLHQRAHHRAGVEVIDPHLALARQVVDLEGGAVIRAGAAAFHSSSAPSADST
jgi:hypothetical protein